MTPVDVRVDGAQLRKAARARSMVSGDGGAAGVAAPEPARDDALRFRVVDIWNLDAGVDYGAAALLDNQTAMDRVPEHALQGARRLSRCRHRVEARPINANDAALFFAQFFDPDGSASGATAGRQKIGPQGCFS
jgi:hypothetical protein